VDQSKHDKLDEAVAEGGKIHAKFRQLHGQGAGQAPIARHFFGVKGYTGVF
jgi:hypothetical protein